MISELYSRLWRVLAGPVGIVVPLLVMLPVVVGYSTLNSVAGSFGGVTIQKIAIILAFVAAALLLGVRLPPIGAWLIFIAIGAGYVVGLFTQARGVDGFDSEMLFGTAGYVYPWLAFFVDWRKIAPERRAGAIALIPLISMALAFIGETTGWLHIELVRTEYTGAERLSAGMPPAYLAGLAFLATAASLWLWSQRRWAGLYLGIINVAVCAATGTRGATVAAGIVFIAGIVAAIIWRLPHWKLSLALCIIGGAGGAYFFLPTLLLRTEESADSAFAGSGRAQAWTYFLQRLEGRELTGYGPGSGPLLASQAQSPIIRNYYVSPHSVYVSFVTDIGVPLAITVGLGFVAVVVAASVHVGVAARVVVVATGVGCLWYGIFDNLLNAPQSALLTGMFFAMAWCGDAFPSGNDRLDKLGRLDVKCDLARTRGLSRTR